MAVAKDADNGRGAEQPILHPAKSLPWRWTPYHEAKEGDLSARQWIGGGVVGDEEVT